MIFVCNIFVEADDSDALPLKLVEDGSASEGALHNDQELRVCNCLCCC